MALTMAKSSRVATHLVRSVHAAFASSCRRQAKGAYDFVVMKTSQGWLDLSVVFGVFVVSTVSACVGDEGEAMATSPTQAETTATGSGTSGSSGSSGSSGTSGSSGSSGSSGTSVGTTLVTSTGVGETGTGTDASTTGDGSTTAGSSSTGGDDLLLSIDLITDENRRYETMFGGWGPHLRGLMRAGDDSLWFTVDAGPDVQNNQRIRYFRRTDGDWGEVAEQAHTPGVQQNVASVMLGDTIYSYGVNISQHFIEECYLNTKNLAAKGCNAVLISGNVYSTPPSSNYIGAAADSGDTRVVWFTRVGPGGAAGDWIYTYNFGGGWNGPVVSPVLGGNDFAYVHAAFVDPGKLAVVGQLYYGKYPDGEFAAAVSEFKLGQKPVFVALQSGEPGVSILSTADLWVDRPSGATHVLARDDKGALRYYFKPPGQAWAGYAEPLLTLPGTFRGRFLRPEGGDLMIARGDAMAGSVELLRVAGADPSQAVQWDAAESLVFPSPGDGFAPPSAIYVESGAYQTTPVGGINLGFCGVYKLADNEIWWAHASSE